LIRESRASSKLGPVKAAVVRYFRALKGAVYLLTLGFFKKSQLGRIGVLVDTLNPKKKPRPLLPLSPMSAITDLSQDIILPHPEELSGNVSLLELVYLSLLAKTFKPHRLMELGTFNGRTTLHLAANTTPDSEIYTLDLPTGPASSTKAVLDADEVPFVADSSRQSRLYNSTPWTKKIHELKGDSTQFDFSDYFGTIDFIFVDASHVYENVVQDTENALKLLKTTGGIIVWHDYNGWDGVTKAVNELYARLKEPAGFFHVSGTSMAIYKTLPR
jgi:predicted O-methyltransferase YrrM